jgi:hypothetical protein
MRGSDMDALVPVLILGGMVFVAWLSWFVARRFGVLPGLILPVLGAAIATARAWMPIGHAEEAMGRGMEVVFIWTPLIGMSALAALAGLAMRKWAQSPPSE